MKKQIKSTFRIIGGRIDYNNPDFAKNINSMKDEFEGSYGEVEYKIIDSPAYWQHKYLHGYLLKDIALAMGEKDTEYIKQFILKPKFLFRKIENGDWKQIPSKYVNKCRIIMDNGVVTGYIPSTSALTFDEMDQFLKDSDNFLIMECNGSIGMATDQIEAMKIRDLTSKK